MLTAELLGSGCDERGAPVTAYRRGRAQVLVNLIDQPTGPVRSPAPAVFDTDDPAITPSHPRTATVRLTPRQALLLVDVPR